MWWNSKMKKRDGTDCKIKDTNPNGKENKNNQKVTKTITVLVALIIVIEIVMIYLLIIQKTNSQAKSNSEEISTEKWNLEKVEIVYDIQGTPVPVPKGYTASSIEGENIVSTGFVIYEGNEAVTAQNAEEAWKTRNQYVWVPVYNASDIYGTLSDGTLYGKLYDYTETGRTLKEYDTTSNYEPDITSTVTNENVKTDYLPSTLTTEQITSLYEEMQTTFKQTIESIETYGGFYIGRYETGNLSATATVTKMNTDISSQNWYTMYTQCQTLKGDNDNVETSMIWGSMWDATLEWLVESGSKTYSEIAIDSSEWGNYKNSELAYTSTNGEEKKKQEGTDTKVPTGSSESTKANNIYDLSGNVREWTLETDSSFGKVYRGGSYYNDGSEYTASDRFYSSSYYPTYGNMYLGCRAMMYIGIG